MKHVHTIPVDQSLTVDDAWHELCLMGVRATDTGAETWATVECDGEECCRIADGSRPPMCEAHNPEGYGCTLDEGHDGAHEAGGSFPRRTWVRSDGSDEAGPCPHCFRWTCSCPRDCNPTEAHS